MSANPLLGKFLQEHAFDEIIDVRTPLEFAEDHVEGAINLPVLSNEERVKVGTLYASDKLQGRKVGAALITQNISQHILGHFKVDLRLKTMEKKRNYSQKRFSIISMTFLIESYKPIAYLFSMNRYSFRDYMLQESIIHVKFIFFKMPP